MNIALLASQYYPHVGGVEEVVRHLAAEYRRRGHRPVVVTNRWPRSLPAHEELDGFTVYRLAFRAPEPGLKAWINYRLTSRLVSARLHRILRSHRADVIHVHCVSANALYALRAKRAAGLPLVTTLHGELTMDATRVFERSEFFRQVLAETLTRSDAVTACSRSTLADARRFDGGEWAERASVVYGGIRLAEFDESPAPLETARPFILAIGRHVPQKGFDLLIRAFAEASLPTHDLVIAGDGPERERLIDLAATAGVADRVRFPGRADRPAAVSLFKGCDFFVLPSRQEPMGIVSLEAMAAGKAVAASRTGGVPEIVGADETGLLFESDDVPAMAGAIRRLALDPALRARLGGAGRQRAETYDWPIIAEQYLRIYRSLLQIYPSRCDRDSVVVA